MEILKKKKKMEILIWHQIKWFYGPNGENKQDFVLHKVQDSNTEQDACGAPFSLGEGEKHTHKWTPTSPGGQEKTRYSCSYLDGEKKRVCSLEFGGSNSYHLCGAQLDKEINTSIDCNSHDTPAEANAKVLCKEKTSSFTGNASVRIRPDMGTTEHMKEHCVSGRVSGHKGRHL